MLILACLFIFVLTIENFINLVRAGRWKDDFNIFLSLIELPSFDIKKKTVIFLRAVM